MVHLANPGLPSHSLDQLAYDLLEGSGIAVAVSGPFNLDDLVSDLSRVIPYFADSVPLENGLAAHPDHQSLWVGLDGPMGSAVLLFIHPSDARLVAREIVSLMPEVEPRWHRSTASNGDMEAAAAVHLEGANAVPAWEFLVL